MEDNLNQLVVDVWPEVNFLNKPYSYLINPKVKNFDLLAVGTVVRVPLHGRTVKGWVDRIRSLTDFLGEESASDKSQLKSVIACISVGPRENVVKLAVALKDLYFTSPAHFLNFATFKKNVLKNDYYSDLLDIECVPHKQIKLGQTQENIVRYLNNLSEKLKHESDTTNADASEEESIVIVRHPPNSDLTWLISNLSYVKGSIVILTPTVTQMDEVFETLKRNGIDVAYESRYEPKLISHKVYIGNRNSIFTSKPAQIEALIILDCENSLYIDERSPCFNAIEVAKLRSSIEKFYVVLCSTNPSAKTVFTAKSLSDSKGRSDDLENFKTHHLFSYPKTYEYNSWPYVEIVKKFEDTNKGLLNEKIIDQIESAVTKNNLKVLVIYQQKGYVNALKCTICDTSAVCEKCGSALKTKRLDSKSLLYCQFCDALSVRMCLKCGSFNLKVIKKGFLAVAEELRLVLSNRVKITADIDEFGRGGTDLLINTTAALNKRYHFRVGMAVFLDFDQFLLAPSIEAANSALSVTVDACNILGRKSVKPSPRILIQSALDDHYLFSYLRDLDFEIYAEQELQKRKLFGFPPFVSLAHLSSTSKKVLDDFVHSIDDSSLEILGPTPSNEYVLKGNHKVLSQYLNLDQRSSKIKIKLELSI